MPTIEEIRAFPDYETKLIDFGRIVDLPHADRKPLSDAYKQSAHWMDRESKRLIGHSEADKTYDRLPDSWYDWLIPTHYAHRSEDDRTQIAFTKTTRKGLQDVQTRMKLGRYLQEYYSDRFDPDDIRDLVRQLTPCEYTMARTPREIARVYENGPHSCMSGTQWYRRVDAVCERPLDGDDDHHNPVGVYATEDVGVAYVEHDNRITARAVVNLRDRKFDRVYGDRRLHDALEADGFTCATYALAGCRLRKIPIQQRNQHYFLMPYLDGAGYVVERGDFLVATNRDSGSEHFARWGIKTSDLIAMGGTDPVSSRIMYCELTNQRVPNTGIAYRVVEEPEDMGSSIQTSPTGSRIYLRRMEIARDLIGPRTWYHAGSGRHILIEPNHTSVLLDNGHRMFAEEARHYADRCWLTNRLLPRAMLIDACVGYTVAEDGEVTFEVQHVMEEAAFYCSASSRYWVITEQTCMANGNTLSKYALSQRINIVTDEYTGLPWARSSCVRLAGPGKRYARRSIFQRVGHTDGEGKKYLSYNHYLESQQQELPMAAE